MRVKELLKIKNIYRKYKKNNENYQQYVLIMVK